MEKKCGIHLINTPVYKFRDPQAHNQAPQADALLFVHHCDLWKGSGHILEEIVLKYP